MGVTHFEHGWDKPSHAQNESHPLSSIIREVLSIPIESHQGH